MSGPRRVPLRCEVGGVALWTPGLRLVWREADPGDAPLGRDAILARLRAMDDHAPRDCAGAMLAAQPCGEQLPALARAGTRILYASRRQPRHLVELCIGRAAWQARLGASTRATIVRKLRKFAAASGGLIDWRSYRGEAEIEVFWRLARDVSARSWQARRLDAGLPGGTEFLAGLRARARRDAVRGYLLFLGAQPVAYTLCPVDDGILRYAHVGFDPAAAALSPGAVLQWKVLGALLDEGCHRLFDFTPGDGQHKRIFATRSVDCADVMLLRASPAALAVVGAQRGCDIASAAGAAVLARMGVLARMRALLRR